MSYSIRDDHEILGLRAIRLEDKESGEFAEIIPGLGGMVHSVGLRKNGQVHDILAKDHRSEIHNNPLFRGRILFPFNDRIPGGNYKFRNRSFQLEANNVEDGSAIHGLVYDKNFEITGAHKNENEASIILQRNFDGKDKGYPFCIHFSVRYCLRPGSFRLEFFVENLGERSAPVAIGWHPYFSLGQKADQLGLHCESDGYVAVGEDLIPTREHPSCEGTNFDFHSLRCIGSTELDIALRVPENGITTLVNGKSAIVLHQDPKVFRYVQVFVPPDRNSVAVEPVSAATNAFNFHEMGLTTLSPGQKLDTWTEVQLTPSVHPQSANCSSRQS